MKPNRQESRADREAAELALCKAISGLSKPKDIQAFMKDLCTPAELQALVDRWQVVTLLDAGMPYRQINAETGVSVTTIGRVARFLADGFGGYAAALNKKTGK